jgi:hypothetical protein
MRQSCPPPLGRCTLDCILQSGRMLIAEKVVALPHGAFLAIAGLHAEPQRMSLN